MTKSNRSHTSSHDETKVKLSSLTSPDVQQQLQFREDKLQARITNIQTTTALATIKLAANSGMQTEQQNIGVQDGYTEDVRNSLFLNLESLRRNSFFVVESRSPKNATSKFANCYVN